MVNEKEKFATKIDKDVINQIRELAKAEGRQIQYLVEEALKAYIQEIKSSAPRKHIMATYQKSHAQYAQLYKKLAE